MVVTAGDFSMKTVIAIYRSPRKTWNTARLLEHVLKGATSEGAEIELIHLYDLDFKGCTSCFMCKLKDGKSYEKCAMQQDWCETGARDILKISIQFTSK
jgi:multimeric flavodoxin WrbA